MACAISSSTWLSSRSGRSATRPTASSRIFSVFYAVGEEAEVLGCLTGICRNLSELPLDRLETEKRILTTESVSRTPGWRDRSTRALRHLR
jgi:hypothetical protein